MGLTKPQYPVFEIAVSCEHGGTHSGGLKERKCVGDIIAIRKPAGAVGRLEQSGYLWLRIEGLEENDMARLTEPMTDTGNVDTATVIYDKRRYCIPFERLQAIVPSFNVSRALNAADKYQPFIGVDEEPPYRFVREQRPLNVHGLIFDKQTRKFI